MTVQIAAVSLSYGDLEVFADVSATIRPRDRVALLGRNGAGKTSLLRLVAGQLQPDRGAVHVPGGTRVALHDQRPPIASGETLGAYVGAGAARAAALEARLRSLEERMAAGDERALAAYDRAQHEFEHAGGYAWRSRLASVLRGLGFGEQDAGRPLSTFSGGELTRAALGRALAAEPDVLLLDEPTNHLDLAAIEWLEGHLAGLDASVVFVSHDRWFLESMATSVLELDRGRARLVRGSYSSWREQRALAMAQQADLYERQHRELAHLQRFVDRFRYGTKSRQAQSKLKAMARIERVDRPTEQKSLAFGFRPPARSGRIVLEARGLSVDVAGRRLVHEASFAIERSQRVALVGRNGAGKTTLLLTLLGRRAPWAGTARLGHGVTAALWSQQSLELREDLRVVEAVQDGTGLTRAEARALLGRFLFSGEEAERDVAVLSGGERRRLALARLVVSGANLLVLDEPTNHLDVESRESLEDALVGFPGTVLFVSHDRALIDAVATRTLAIEDGRIVARDGGWADLLRAREEAAAAVAAAEPAPARPRAPKETPSARGAERPRRTSGGRAAREAARLETLIASREEELGALETRLSQPDGYADPTAVAEDGRRHQELQRELAWLMREWERYAVDATR